MKKTSLLLVILHLSVMVFSQEYKRRTPEEKAKKYTAEMAAEIHLEKEQEAQIYIIFQYLNHVILFCTKIIFTIYMNND